MKYVQVSELELESCNGCVHAQSRFERRNSTCVSDLLNRPGYDTCNGTIYIRDTDEAKRDHLVRRFKGIPL